MHPSKGLELCYSAIIPNDWLRIRSEEDIINIIFRELARRLLNDDDYMINQSEISIDGVKVKICISNNCLTWCFLKDVDNEVNDNNYQRINCISALFQKMVHFHAQRRAVVAAINMIDEDEGFYDVENDV